MGTRAMRAAALDRETRTRVLAAPTAAGQVHSVFARAVNLLWHDGRLVALHGPGLLRAPFAVALEGWPDPDDVAPGQPVERRASWIAFDGIAVDLEPGATADLRLRPAEHRPEALCWALNAVARPAAAPSLSSPAAQEAQDRLREGIRHRDAAQVLHGARGLIGLGEGLTPAGDDCLVGVLAALRAFAPAVAEAPGLRAGIAEAAAGTTLIARDFLLCALDGRFAEAVVRLCAGPVGEAAAAAAALFEVGGTSGADTFLGVQLALDALREAGAPAAPRRHRFRT